MKRLTNSFDNEINFTELEDAKAYYIDDNMPTEKDYLGDDFEDYKKSFIERQEMIRNANSLEELAEALNYMSDVYDNGSIWEVIGD